ncbi:MAG TPA: AbrB/MazE/SpoVT family DNA-binding domain-containing protein [Ideonella sp.]|nr:AbrB/MazE/SpoVT family DNA-binding domain-containing protein [Ideonella sp.]
MNVVTLSPKFQLVVPLAVRERMQLKAGEKLQVISLPGRIELIPLRPMQTLRGAFPGLDTTIERDGERL